MKIEGLRNTKKVDVLVVMGSSLQQKPDGKYYVPLFADFLMGTEDATNVDGDLKASAVSILLRDRKTTTALITGGIQDNKASRAYLLATHTATHYPTDPNHLIALTTKPHSMGNLEQAGTFLDRNPQLLPNRTVGVLTNFFHGLRTETFAQECGYFPPDLHLTYFFTERVLMDAGVFEPRDLAKYYSTPEIRQRRKNELQGYMDFRKGIYSPRS